MITNIYFIFFVYSIVLPLIYNCHIEIIWNYTIFPFSIDWTINSNKHCFIKELLKRKLKKRRNNLTTLYYVIDTCVLWYIQKVQSFIAKFISKPFETHPRLTDMGKIYSLVKFTFSPDEAERELTNFGHADRDCVHFLKRCYRINGSTLHPSADRHFRPAFGHSGGNQRFTVHRP